MPHIKSHVAFWAQNEFLSSSAMMVSISFRKTTIFTLRKHILRYIASIFTRF
jgi:hypothetical protein